MNSIFDIDSPIMRFLSRACDLLILNLITLLCCLPIVTAGASLTAMYYVELKWIRDEEGYIVRPFFREFKNNFKQATGEWLIILLIAAVLGADVYLLQQNPDLFPDFMQYIVLAAMVFAVLVLMWIFPLQCHFYNTVLNTFKNAVILTIAKFPRTLGMAAGWTASALLLYLSLVTELQVIFPLVLLFFLSLPGLLTCKLASKPFQAFEPEEEEQDTVASEEEKEEAFRILTEESAVRHDRPQDTQQS